MQMQTFSAKQARTLVDLCVSAETSAQQLLVIEQGGELYAAFRAGGDPAEPLNVHGTKTPQGIPFGRGIGYGPLVEAYLDAAAGKLDALAGKRVWLTGHGIGGVFALLAAAELLVEGSDIAAVYTFGAPRVGDSQLVNALACPIFRVVNNLDVMATIPPPWRWRHAGRQILINADGSLNLHPNALNRLPSLLRQTLWLGEMLAQGLTSGYPRALHTLLNQVLGDHALESYRNRIHSLSE
jgi:pimeloyl-ACP methyl ester carboxylesterase